jgi:rhodanese-related sulfurtransferase
VEADVSQAEKVHDLTAEEVAAGIAQGRYLLIDVREPNEVAVEAYPDALVLPLSTFDPAEIPDPQGKTVVFACRSGKRSVTASLAAQAGGKPYDSHLAGGMLAWKAAGLPSKTGGSPAAFRSSFALSLRTGACQKRQSARRSRPGHVM